MLDGPATSHDPQFTVVDEADKFVAGLDVLVFPKPLGEHHPARGTDFEMYTGGVLCHRKSILPAESASDIGSPEDWCPPVRSAAEWRSSA